MKKINNRGFAISAILYTMLILTILLMFLIVQILANNRATSNKVSSEVKGKVDSLDSIPEPILSSKGDRKDTTFGNFKIIQEVDIPVGAETSQVQCPRENFSNCYSNTLSYNSDALVLSKKGAAAFADKSSFNAIGDEFSVNITLKRIGNGTNDDYGETIFAISNLTTMLLWISESGGKVNVRTYGNGNLCTINTSDNYKINYSESSIDLEANPINIQVTSKKGGNTIVYINGVKKEVFKSGDQNVDYEYAVVGDLRPGRNSKFGGYVYQVEVYDTVLSPTAVKKLYNKAKKNYNT